MSWIKSPDDILRFNHEVERIAINMCEEFGLDPYKAVVIKYGSDWTPFERSHDYYIPRTFTPPEGEVPTKEVGAPQWRAFRYQAAMALAGWRAINKYTMTEL